MDLAARDYIETTTAAVEGGITDNVPRLDYTDSSCPALLLEPLRTNCDRPISEYIVGMSGLGGNTSTLSWDSSVLNPEGYNAATSYTLNTYVRINDNLTGISAGDTIS